MREKIEWVGGPAWGALTSLSGLPEEGRGRGRGREVRGPLAGRQGLSVETAREKDTPLSCTVRTQVSYPQPEFKEPIATPPGSCSGAALWRDCSEQHFIGKDGIAWSSAGEQPAGG